jgi:dihydroorotate dehydrogenase
MLYRSFARPLLFALPPEWVHHASLAAMTHTPLVSLIEPFARRAFPAMERKLFGLTFPNPIGLAAGFDKNAEGVNVWPRLGFGFMELGTITPRPQPGNPRPRIFRLPAEQGLINRLGFPNIGAEKVAQRLEKIKAAGRWPITPVGLNLGKNKDTPLAEAGRDYVTCFRRTRELADYFVVNVSSPNTPGLRELQNRARPDRSAGRGRGECDGEVSPRRHHRDEHDHRQARPLRAGGRRRERTSPHCAQHGNHPHRASVDWRARADHRRGRHF